MTSDNTWHISAITFFLNNPRVNDAWNAFSLRSYLCFLQNPLFYLKTIIPEFFHKAFFLFKK